MTRFLTVSVTIVISTEIEEFFLQFLLRSAKVARPKRTLESQLSVGRSADRVCVVSS